jgi:protein-tyrosine phosphatase
LNFITKRLRPEPDRVLSISGIGNLRDLGGYPAMGGKTTRWKVILRSAGTERLMPEGQRKLIEYGLRTNIDLRTHYQRETDPDVFKGSSEVDYRTHPIFDTQEFDDRLEALKSAPEAYWLMLTERAASFRGILETVASAREGATLIHCAAGKDRTGLVCALLLGAAGVPEEVIVEDYALSQRILTDPADEYRQIALARGWLPEEYDRLMSSDPATMYDILGRLRQHYGGLTGYISSIGISDDTLARLRTRLIDK